MHGKLRLIQNKRGYRFSIDAILLSEFVTTKPDDVVVDLGTGCGIVPLALLHERSISYVYGLEIQPELADQASRNAVLNGYDHKMAIILGDLKNPPLKASFADVIVCNPPYRQVDDGRINPDSQKAIARHEIMASLDDILGIARRLLKAKGRLAMVYSAVRLTDLLVRMRAFDLEPKRVQVAHPNLESESKLVFVEASAGGKAGLKILPPIIDQGAHTIQRLT